MPKTKPAIADNHIRFLDIRATSADGFDFPALKHDAGFEFFFDEIVAMLFCWRRCSWCGSQRLQRWDARISGFYRIHGVRLKMAMVEKSLLIERSSQQMFDLVDDVENYPKPSWCSQTG